MEPSLGGIGSRDHHVTTFINIDAFDHYKKHGPPSTIKLSKTEPSEEEEEEEEDDDNDNGDLYGELFSQSEDEEEET